MSAKLKIKRGTKASWDSNTTITCFPKHIGETLMLSSVNNTSHCLFDIVSVYPKDSNLVFGIFKVTNYVSATTTTIPLTIKQVSSNSTIYLITDNATKSLDSDNKILTLDGIATLFGYNQTSNPGIGVELQTLSTGVEYTDDLGDTSTSVGVYFRYSKSTTLEPGQPGIEYEPDGSIRMKVGDGTEAKEWADLPYVESPSVSTTTTTTTTTGSARSTYQTEATVQSSLTHITNSRATTKSAGLKFNVNKYSSDSQYVYSSVNIEPSNSNMPVNVGGITELEATMILSEMFTPTTLDGHQTAAIFGDDQYVTGKDELETYIAASTYCPVYITPIWDMETRCEEGEEFWKGFKFWYEKLPESSDGIGIHFGPAYTCPTDNEERTRYRAEMGYFSKAEFGDIYLGHPETTDKTIISSTSNNNLNITQGSGGVKLVTNSSSTSLQPNSETVSNYLGTSSMPWDKLYSTNIEKLNEIDFTNGQSICATSSDTERCLLITPATSAEYSGIALVYNSTTPKFELKPSTTNLSYLGTQDRPWSNVYAKKLVYYASGSSSDYYTAQLNFGHATSSYVTTYLNQEFMDTSDNACTGGIKITTYKNIDNTDDPGTNILPINSSQINRIGSPSNYWSGLYSKNAYIKSLQGVSNINNLLPGNYQSNNCLLSLDAYNYSAHSANLSLYFEASSSTSVIYSTSEYSVLGGGLADPITNYRYSSTYDPATATALLYGQPFEVGFMNRLYTSRIMSNDDTCRCGIFFNRSSDTTNVISLRGYHNTYGLSTDYETTTNACPKINIELNASTGMSDATTYAYIKPVSSYSYIGSNSDYWTAGYMSTVNASTVSTTYLRSRSGTGSSYSVRLSSNAIPSTNSTSSTTGLYLGSSSYKWLAVYAYTGTIQTSDKSAKSDIKYLSNNDAISIPEGQENTSESYITMSDVVDFVKELEPATFCYKNGNGDNPTEEDSSPEAIQLGLIADDICNSKLFKYVGVENEVDDILEPEEIDEQTGEVVKEAVIGDEKKTVRGLQPIPLATAALATCKYLLGEIEGLKEELEALKASN